MSFELVCRMLEDRGVTVEQIAEIVHALQLPFNPNLTLQECIESVESVLRKREVQYTLMTGIALDQLTEEKKLPEPLQTILEKDHPLYGVDEILALGITNVYGSIGLTSFGYLDKLKMGVIGRLNQHGTGSVHTFLDDLVAGIAAAASARLAHQQEEWP
ncbi:MAG: phosphatidylglycerophosphatase A [Bacillaceae bacterium G1]|nr:phosphatidylglycerophosphatase A [Bacillota bacterium]OJF16868.1 MAG: phosphatidylglycerophosphatase A [Bacillaceae bacterium G1]